MTFEDLVTSQNGVTASRALVNVVIDQQIGQQISVCPFRARFLFLGLPCFYLVFGYDVAPTCGPRFPYHTRAPFPWTMHAP